MIPDEAVEAAAYALYLDANPESEAQWFDLGFHEQDELLRAARQALEAAYPILLSHERQLTADAHRDAMVNRETAARLERAIACVLELAAPMRHMVASDEIRLAIDNALKENP